MPNLQGRVALVDFWASWCGPCKKSFPALDALQRKYGAQGLQVVGVSVDQDPAALSRFLDAMPVSFPVVRDTAQKLVAHLRVAAMPSSFLVDRRGVIRFVHTGFHGEETVRDYEREIEALLKEPAGAEGRT